MRKVTREVVQAFLKGEPKKVGNTSTDGERLKLHGNTIAERRQNSGSGLFELWITNAGWATNTTKDRLNALPNVNIFQKDFQWYLNDLPWDGSWTKVN